MILIFGRSCLKHYLHSKQKLFSLIGFEPDTLNYWKHNTNQLHQPLHIKIDKIFSLILTTRIKIIENAKIILFQ